MFPRDEPWKTLTMTHRRPLHADSPDTVRESHWQYSRRTWLPLLRHRHPNHMQPYANCKKREQAVYHQSITFYLILLWISVVLSDISNRQKSTNPPINPFLFSVSHLHTSTYTHLHFQSFFTFKLDLLKLYTHLNSPKPFLVFP